MVINNVLVFLKLGGSLITDKTQPRQALPDVLKRLAGEIAGGLSARPELRLLLGHGSGSFGHIPARQYRTRQGVFDAEGWRGFAEVWKEAAALNYLVMDALHAAGLPAVALPASAAVEADNGQAVQWNLEPLQSALQNGLLPVVYGDVVFDRTLGGTILSTEDLFVYLARQLQPGAILLAGSEPGVWEDFPACTALVEKISSENYLLVAEALGESAAVDVTGGMRSKVQEMLELTQQQPGLQVRIFSGRQVGAVKRALAGESVGTLICSG